MDVRSAVVVLVNEILSRRVSQPPLSEQAAAGVQRAPGPCPPTGLLSRGPALLPPEPSLRSQSSSAPPDGAGGWATAPPRGASFCAPVKLRHFRFPSLLLNMAMLFFTLFLLFCETGWLCFPMSYRNSTQIWLIWGSSLLIVTDTSVPSEGSETQSLWDHSDQNLTLHQVLAPD